MLGGLEVMAGKGNRDSNSNFFYPFFFKRLLYILEPEPKDKIEKNLQTASY